MRSNILFMAAVAMAGSLACQVATAQASSPSRADVKAEAAAATKSGETGAGVRRVDPKSSGTTSTMTRDERKKATAEANKAGELEGAGVRGPSGPAVTSKSTTTRAERKKATAEANKKGQLAPAGDTNKP
jgi:hypothetical protein